MRHPAAPTAELGTDDELPEGWVAATLPMLFRLNPPKAKAADYPDNLPVTFVPMPAVDALTGTIRTPAVRNFGAVKKGFTSFRDGDVILAKITPCMENGKAAVVGGMLNGLGFGSTEFHVFRPTGAVLPEYLFHFLRQESFRRNAADEMTGSVGQKRVPAEFLTGVELPVPPLAEQRRIVAAVRRVLDKVSSAHARLDRMPATLKRFRQAVLAAACSGRLTADWRSGHEQVSAIDSKACTDAVEADDLPELPMYPDNWLVMTVSNCAALVQYGTSEKADPLGTIPLLRMGNLQNGYISLADLKMTNEQLPGLSSLLLQSGDLLFNRTNSPELVGKAAIYQFSDRATFASYLIRVRCKDGILDARLLCWWLNSPWGREWAAKVRTDGVSQSNINGTKLQQMPIGVPPLAEQHEIVRRVSALFAHADAIEARTAAARKRVDALTQAVLAKAFRGELVPTEAELARRDNRPYEPAADLLVRLRASAGPVTKVARGRKPKGTVSP